MVPPSITLTGTDPVPRFVAPYPFLIATIPRRREDLPKRAVFGRLDKIMGHASTRFPIAGAPSGGSLISLIGLAIR